MPHPGIMQPMLTTESAIATVAAGLVDCTLPAAEWTHEAHFAAALWMLRHQPGFNTAAMAPIIRRYNLACGKENSDTAGYHETITRASLAAAAAALAAMPGAPLPEVLAQLLAGPCGGSGWLLAYWRRETLFSPAARRAWLAPDLAPLPFQSN